MRFLALHFFFYLRNTEIKLAPYKKHYFCFNLILKGVGNDRQSGPEEQSTRDGLPVAVITLKGLTQHYKKRTELKLNRNAGTANTSIREKM